jgi:ankyrin repeat protein
MKRKTLTVDKDNSKYPMLDPLLLDNQLLHVIRSTKKTSEKIEHMNIIFQNYNQPLKCDRSLLYCAASGQLDIFDFILSKTKDISPKTALGYSSLALAVFKEQVEILRYILGRHDFVLNEQELNIALKYCAYRGFEETLNNIIIRKNVDLNVKDSKGTTPLMMATLNNHERIVSILLQHPGTLIEEKNIQGQTACHIACARGHKRILESLIRHGCDINATDNAAMMPLHYACQENHVDVVKLLLSHNVIVDAPNNDDMTPLQFASQEGATEIVRMLLSTKRVEVNRRDRTGMTAIRLAVIRNQVATIEELLKFGADPSIFDNNGYSCLHTIANFGHSAALATLVESNTALNFAATSESGNNPLVVAIFRGHLPIVHKLIQLCPELKTTKKSNIFSMLHVARRSKQDKIVEYFRANGVKKCYDNLESACSICETSFCTVCCDGEERCQGKNCTFKVCHLCAKENPLETISLDDEVKYCKSCARLARSEKILKLRLWKLTDIHCKHFSDIDIRLIICH